MKLDFAFLNLLTMTIIEPKPICNIYRCEIRRKTSCYTCVGKQKVVGLSATAALPTVLGNYNLKYIKEQLKSITMNFLMKQGPPYRELEMLWRPYKEGRIQINLQVVDRGKDHLLLSERLEDIFSQRTLAQKYTHRFTALGAEEYVQNRYCNMLTAMKAFWTHPDIRAFLCLNQVLPMPGKRAMDENLLRDALKDLQKYMLHRPLEKWSSCAVGNNLRKTKTVCFKICKTGAKRFITIQLSDTWGGQNPTVSYPRFKQSCYIGRNTEYDEKILDFRKRILMLCIWEISRIPS